MAVSEFDAFGPWIYPVDRVDEAPELFQPYLRAEEPWELCLKLPRNIERRRAAPGMDLYDDLLCAYGDRVLLLHRGGRAVQRTAVPYRAICRVGLARKLLQGSLALHLADRTVTVPFNAVSMDLMGDFVRVLRRHMTEGGTGGAAPFREVPVSDTLLQNLLEDFRGRGETFAVGAFQAQAPLEPSGSRRRPRRMSVLPALAVLAGDGELLLARREADPRRKSEAGLGYALAYVPLRQVRGVRLEADPVFAAWRLTLVLNRGEVVGLFARDNPTVKGCFAGLRGMVH